MLPLPTFFQKVRRLRQACGRIEPYTAHWLVYEIVAFARYVIDGKICLNTRPDRILDLEGRGI